ncbi:uncharacterized protein [Euwallacea fornicatus]|uniref:uncharacterized protein n=1 Tax=Euwallacea fornicatus TaxID=995702 RepID=UPI00338E3B55
MVLIIYLLTHKLFNSYIRKLVLQMEYRQMETGAQLFSRLKPESSRILDGINPKLFPEGGPLVNQVIEVLHHQNFNYTDFFVDFIVRALLPSKLDPSFKESQVILLHTDCQISLLKVIKFIEKKCGKNNSIVEECLKRLVKINCYCAEEMERTFFNLERIIGNCEKPGLVVLDNCLSQYWIAKFEERMLSFDKHAEKTVNLLYEKIKDLNVVLMYGRPFWSGGNSIKPGAQVTYSIYIAENETGFEAQVKNVEKNVSYIVPFNVSAGIDFL